MKNFQTSLEFAFGEGDRVDRAGGGLESHPRLTDTVLYRAADSNTIMRNARETILALAPKGFNISLSSCFNYTQNYREGTFQAKRHHSGKGINACLSLHKPPRTGVEQFVVNVHWSTQNVNLTLDFARSNPDNVMVDSKDAKAKVHADVSPVQKPGKTWRRITLPDHDWCRLAHQAVTPMSHLFVETELILEEEGGQSRFYSVRRTGTAATLINISYFEPETVQRVFNELFLLLVNPALDHVFRNPNSGKLKEHFVFGVDNGPSEKPNSPLVRMWLVRLMRLLNLMSVTQKSFAEYHSKRNPVERVHAVQNHALSNEQFTSKGVHSVCEIGDQKHRENMEHMAEEVRKCLSHTQYGGKPCLSLRGIGGEENFILNDEADLITFLGKSECRKNEDVAQYEPIKNDLWKEVCVLWGLKEDFVGSYSEDYQVLQNTLEEEGERTSWMDHYSTTVFNPDLKSPMSRVSLTLQPIPDYVRWLNTGGQLHFMPYEKMQELKLQVVAETPAVFLPSKILEMTFKIFPHGVDHILPSIAFLTWITENDVQRFFKEFEEKNERSFLDDKEREYWNRHELYREKDKAELQGLCRKKGLSVEGKKHDCVKRLVERMELTHPPPLDVYDGNIHLVPDSVTEIAKLSVYRLRVILRYHNILDCGTKDELSLRVGMLKAGRCYLAFYKELEAIKNLITATRSIITAEKELYLCDPTVVHKRRKYATPSGASIGTSRPRDSASIANKKQSPLLYVPPGISLENLEEVLDPLMKEVILYQQHQWVANEDCVKLTYINQLAATRAVGARVLAHWSTDEVGASGWKTGKHIIPYYRFIYTFHVIVICCYSNILINTLVNSSIVASSSFAVTLKKPDWAKQLC